MRNCRRRNSTEEAVRGQKPASTVLILAQEMAIVPFRQQTFLPFDHCLYALQEATPNLSRSVLHHCSQRHGINHLPSVDKPAAGTKKAKFKDNSFGY